MEDYHDWIIMYYLALENVYVWKGLIINNLLFKRGKLTSSGCFIIPGRTVLSIDACNS